MIDEEEYWFHQNKRLDFELQQQKVQIVHICMFFRLKERKQLAL